MIALEGQGNWGGQVFSKIGGGGSAGLAPTYIGRRFSLRYPKTGSKAPSFQDSFCPVVVILNRNETF
ncbi:hypothetical protein NW819_02485, partial [Synechococcus sp. R8-2]